MTNDGICGCPKLMIDGEKDLGLLAKRSWTIVCTSRSVLSLFIYLYGVESICIDSMILCLYNVINSRDNMSAIVVKFPGRPGFG